MLIYIHGFNSSARSFKARLLRDHLAALGRAQEFACPDLSHWPEQASAQLEQLIERNEAAPITLVGSSLGGYYATWLAERHHLKAVLLNPAVRPYESLTRHLGAQQNLYTGEEYLLTEAHIEQLRALEVTAISRPERYLLITATGDEVLDYRLGVEKYQGARQIMIQGGDHGLSDFARYLPQVLAFASITGPQ